MPYKFTGKERDEETGLYYFGARYLDAKYSRWLSCDPALGEYIPIAATNDEAKRHNSNLPGMGGVYNHINCNLYHYAGNNTVRYIDPDGRNVTNNTKVPITVRTENGYYVVLEPGDEYVGRQDGVLCPDGTTYISEDVKSEAEKRKSSEGMEE